MRRVWPIVFIFVGMAALMCAAILGAVYYLGGWQPSPPKPAEAVETNWFDQALTTTAALDDPEGYEDLCRRAAAEPDHEEIIADRLDDLDPNELMRLTGFISDLSGLEARDSYLPLLDTCFHKLPQRWRALAVFGYGNYPWSKVGERVKAALVDCEGDEHIQNAVVAVAAGAYRNQPEPELAPDIENVLRGLLDAKVPLTRNRVIWYLMEFGWMKADEAEPLLDALIAEHPELKDDWPTEYSRKIIEDQRKDESSEGGG